MVPKIIFAFVLVATVLADKLPSRGYQQASQSHNSDLHHSDQDLHSGSSHHSEESSGPAEYNFEWAVKDDEGNDFGHEETRDGDSTKGSYYVLLPDGRTQKVTYHVDGDSGYVAEVTYEGEAHSQEQQEEQSHAPPPPPPQPQHRRGRGGYN